MLEKERIEEEEAVADGGKEDNQQKDGAEIIVDVMASTVTEQCACSPEGGEDLSVDMGCSSAQLTSQLEPPLAEEKRSEERETIVTACFICKRRGHLAKDCPNAKTQILQAQSCEFCLKCGDKGHDMFTCKDGYSSTDLEKIQCGVCKAFGHLSCVDYKDYGPKQVSCYNCGMICHLGSDCLNLRRNIQLAFPSCKKGGTGPSCSEGNNSADHTLQDEKKGDKYLLCEDKESAKVQDLLQQMERSDVLGSEVASKKVSRSRWRKRKWQRRKTVRIAEGGRMENGSQCGMRQEYQSSEEAKPNCC